MTDKGHTDEIIATWHVACCMLAFESGSNLVGFGLVVVPRNIGQCLSACRQFLYVEKLGKIYEMTFESLPGLDQSTRSVKRNPDF